MGGMTMEFAAPKSGLTEPASRPAIASASSSRIKRRRAIRTTKARWSAESDDRGAHPLVDREPIPRADGDRARHRLGRLAVMRTPLDATARPLRRAGDHPHDLARAGAADRRGPGHLSADDHDAVGPRREDGARLLVLRRLVRLHPVRRTAPIRTGRARACSSTSTRCSRGCRRRRSPRSGPTPPAWAGSTSTRSSTARAASTWASCARCRTGSSSTS